MLICLDLFFICLYFGSLTDNIQDVIQFYNHHHLLSMSLLFYSIIKTQKYT